MNKQDTETQKNHKKCFKKHFCTVTPLSRILALVLFIALPFVGFWIGMKYAHQPVPLCENLNLSQEEIDIVVAKASEGLEDAWGEDFQKVITEVEATLGCRVEWSNNTYPKPKDTLRTYRNNSFEFEFEYPSGWSVTKEEPNNALFDIVLEHRDTQTTINILLQGAPLSGINPIECPYSAREASCVVLTNQNGVRMSRSENLGMQEDVNSKYLHVHAIIGDNIPITFTTQLTGSDSVSLPGRAEAEEAVDIIIESIRIISGVTESVEKDEGYVERDYKISCGEVSDYVRNVTSVCEEKEDGFILTYDSNPGSQSNFEFKNNEYTKLIIQIAEAENGRVQLYQESISMFDERVEEYQHLEEQYEGEFWMYRDFDDKLVEAKPTFIQLETDWLKARDSRCNIQQMVIAPGASGTNGLETFEYLNCILTQTEQHVTYLEKIHFWLEVSDPSRGVK